MRRSLVLLGFALAFVAPGLQSAGESSPPPCQAANEFVADGVVEAVRTHAGWMGWDGVYVTLQVKDRSYEVHVAPASFLAALDVDLRPGDALEVRGCRTKTDGQEALIARQVRRGNVVITLRDAQGLPVW